MTIKKFLFLLTLSIGHNSFSITTLSIELKATETFTLQVFYLDNEVTKWSENGSVYKTINSSDDYKVYRVELANKTQLHNFRLDLGAKPSNNIFIKTIVLEDNGLKVSEWNGMEIFSDFFLSNFIIVKSVNLNEIQFETIPKAPRYDPYIHLYAENNRLRSSYSPNVKIKLSLSTLCNCGVSVSPYEERFNLPTLFKNYKHNGVSQVMFSYYGVEEVGKLYLSITCENSTTILIDSLTFENSEFTRVLIKDDIKRYFSLNRKESGGSLQFLETDNLYFSGKKKIRSKTTEKYLFYVSIVAFCICSYLLVILNSKIILQKPA